MSSKYDAFLVVMKDNVSEGEALAISSAIKQLRGVLDVSAHVGDITGHIAESRARQKIGEAVWSAIYPEAK